MYGKEATAQIKAQLGAFKGGADAAVAVVLLWEEMGRQIASGRLTEADVMSILGGIPGEAAIALGVTRTLVTFDSWMGQLSERYLGATSIGELNRALFSLQRHQTEKAVTYLLQAGAVVRAANLVGVADMTVALGAVWSLKALGDN